MTYLTVLALAVVGLFGLAAWLAIWSRRDTVGRPLAVLLFAVGIPATAAAFADSLGYHRPLWLAYDLKPGEHVILGYHMVQDRAIYIYLKDESREEPRPLVLPWSNEAASQLQQAMDGAPEGMEGMALFRYDPDGQQAETVFHPFPQPPDPPAKAPPDRGFRYEQPEI